MTHELDFKNNKYSFAHVGQKAWHGLGQQMNPNTDLNVWLKQANMDFTVKDSLVKFVLDDGTEQTLTSRVLYRSDTKKPLSIVSKDYKVVQPKEILFFFKDLIENLNLTLETAGVLKGGKKTWALSKLPENLILTDNDVVNGYLLLTTSYDKSLATTCQITTIRVVCNNTLEASMGKETEHILKVNHNNVFNAEKIKLDMGLVSTHWIEMQERLRYLEQQKMSDNERQSFYKQLVNLPEKITSEKQEIEKLQKTEMINTLNRIYYEAEGQNLKSCKNTRWGVLNSVTYFADHYRGLKPLQTKYTDSHTHNRLFGQSSRLKQKAFQLLIK